MHKPGSKLFIIMLLWLSALPGVAADLLVSTDWVASQMKNKHIVLIDMSDDTQYSRFHLPGARHLPYAAINQRSKTGVSLSAGRSHLVKVLGFLGIKNSDHIVIYDDMAGLHASRLFWELERLGHPRISIMDGGLVKWILEGRKVTNQTQNYSKSQYKASGKGRDNLASLDNVNQAKNGKTLLLDVRSQQEYTGHPRQPRSGHIPGAKWWDWEQAGNFEQAFTMQSIKQVKGLLETVDATDAKKPVILYCRSGHRAAHTYFTLRRLGYDQVKLYDGSMAEYEQFKQLPLTRGVSP